MKLLRARELFYRSGFFMVTRVDVSQCFTFKQPDGHFSTSFVWFFVHYIVSIIFINKTCHYFQHALAIIGVNFKQNTNFTFESAILCDSNDSNTLISQMSTSFFISSSFLLLLLRLAFIFPFHRLPESSPSSYPKL